jgi:hypothetical protein
METRVRLVASYLELRRLHPDYSAHQFYQYLEAPYFTFYRWLARWRRQGRLAMVERSRRPHHFPRAISGQELTVICRAHQLLGYGVRRLYAPQAP